MGILLSPYLLIAVVVIVLVMWSQRFHWWSITGTQRHPASALQVGLTAAAASDLFLIAGIMGFDLKRHERFVDGTAWNGVNWSEITIGLILVPVAIYLIRRSNPRIGHG